MGVMKAKRQDPDFEKILRVCAKLDPNTGNVRFENIYASVSINVGFKGSVVSISQASLVWFLTKGRWQKEGYHIDHINDDPMDNRPSNLQELTAADNHAKRRGRAVYRSYGKGKYGYGMGIYHDKRDNCYYISRNISRGFGEGDLKGMKVALGREDTLEEAENRVRSYIEEIKVKGLDYIPPPVTKKEKKATINLDNAAPKLRLLRKQGKTIQEIADLTGFDSGSIYKRIRDIPVDCRKVPKTNS